MARRCRECIHHKFRRWTGRSRGCRCARGQAERRTHDYTRCGTTSLFAALDVKAGTIIGRCFPSHRAVEFRRFLDAWSRSRARRSRRPRRHGQCRRHKITTVRGWLAKRPALARHYTPTSSSWINQVERFFSPAHRARRPAPRRPSQPAQGYEAAIHRFIEASNADAQALLLDQDRRRHPRLHPALLASGSRQPEVTGKTSESRTLGISAPTTLFRPSAARPRTTPSRGQAARLPQVGTVDEGSLVGGEEGDACGDVLGRADPADRDTSGPASRRCPGRAPAAPASSDARCRIEPGLTELRRTPCGPYSTAIRAREAQSPALAAL